MDTHLLKPFSSFGLSLLFNLHSPLTSLFLLYSFLASSSSLCLMLLLPQGLNSGFQTSFPPLPSCCWLSHIIIFLPDFWSCSSPCCQWSTYVFTWMPPRHLNTSGWNRTHQTEIACILVEGSYSRVPKTQLSLQTPPCHYRLHSICHQASSFHLWTHLLESLLILHCRRHQYRANSWAFSSWIHRCAPSSSLLPLRPHSHQSILQNSSLCPS